MTALAEWLLGPLFARELVAWGRRRRTFALRAVYGAALLVTLLVAYRSGSYDVIGRNAQAIARLAEHLFLWLAWVQFLAVFLIVPPIVGGAVAAEREAHTLDLLLTTRLAPREILAGKLGLRLLWVGMILATGWPVIGLLALVGGIDPWQTVRALAATLLAVGFSGATAIYFSTVSRTTLGALVRTYWRLAWLILVLPLFTILVVELFDIGPSDPGAVVVYAQAFVNPLFIFCAGVIDSFREDFDSRLGVWWYPASYLPPAAWSAWLTYAALVRLRQPVALPAAAREAAGTPSRRFPAWAAATAWCRRARQAAARPWWPGQASNPLVMRAVAARVYDREGYLGRLQLAGVALLAAFLLLLAWAEPDALGDEDLLAVLVMVIWAVVGVFTALVAATSLSGDRRRGFLDAVLVTPLEADEIVDGTLWAVRRHVRLGYLTGAVVTLGWVLLGEVRLPEAILSASVAWCFGRLLSAYGVACAWVAEHTGPPLVMTLLMPVVVCLGVPLAGAVIGLSGEELRHASGAAAIVGGVALLLAAGRFARRRSAVTLGVAGLGLYYLLTGVVSAALALVFAEAYYDAYFMDSALTYLNNPSYWIFAPLERSDFLDRVAADFPADMPWMAWYPIAAWLAYLATLVGCERLIRGWLVRDLRRTRDPAPPPRRPAVAPPSAAS